MPQPELQFLPDGTKVDSRTASCPVDVSGHGDTLFFVNRGDIGTGGGNWSVSACPAGSACFDIAHDTIPNPHGQPETIAPTNDQVYLGTSAGRLVQWPVRADAGAPIELVPGGERFNALAVNDTWLYWIGLQNTIRGCERSSCTPHDVSSDTTVQQIAAGTGGVYWTSLGAGRGQGSVFFLANGSDLPVKVVEDAAAPAGITLDSGYLYFGNSTDTSGNAARGSIARVKAP